MFQYFTEPICWFIGCAYLPYTIFRRAATDDGEHAALLVALIGASDRLSDMLVCSKSILRSCESSFHGRRFASWLQGQSARITRYASTEDLAPP